MSSADQTPMQSAETPTAGPVARRTGNYQPNRWNLSFLESLRSDYIEEKYMKQREKMKDEVRHILINIGVMKPLARLELVEAVQRLGLEYHFEMEIKEALNTLYNDESNTWWFNDLYATSLRFRLLRQHGHKMDQDVFYIFKDNTGEFMTSLCEDVMGLLSLYEASFLGFEDENIMDEALAFTTKHLMLLQGQLSQRLAKKVEQALDLPLHWRMPRLETRWFIDTYEQEPDMNLTLLKLAQLDFNIVQSIHQREVTITSRWSSNLGLDKVSFARDRSVENFTWGLGIVFEPRFHACRNMLAKVIGFVTIIDDFFDVYGFVEELELFTDFVERWDISKADQLPQNMGTCLIALYNTCNEMGEWSLKEGGFNVFPYLSKMWADLCKAYLKEAKWYHEGYKPTMKEYVDNAVVTVTGPIVLFTAYFSTAEKITMDELEYLYSIPILIRYSSLLTRLNNDLGTSSHELARGDTLKAVECYINESGASPDVACEHIKSIVRQTWKKLNKFMIDRHPFSESFVRANLNAVRASHFFYQHGDGHSFQDGWTKDLLLLLLVQPIPFNNNN